MFIPSPPFFLLIYFLFPFSPLQSSILHPLSSPIPYPLYPYPLYLYSSIFNLQSISPFSTPHSSLFTSSSSSSSTTTTLHFFFPPLPPSSFPLLLPHTHTHTHNLRYAISLQSFFFIKEYGTFSIVCPATWFIKKVGMGLKGV